MLGELFVALCRVPYLRKKLWGNWYEFLARNYRGHDWTFMNYGFQGDSALPLTLQAADEANRFCIQLYNHVAGAIDLSGLNVLEVGSGRGGGASFIARYLNPDRVTGVDLAANAVAFCRNVHRVQNLEFQQGEAGHLPFADSTFDAVVNVESSHCYSDLARFFREVRRTMKTNGHFLYADLHDSDTLEEWRTTLTGSGFTIVRETNITPSVLVALDRDSDRKEAAIRNLAPALLQPSFNDFAAVRGSKIYEAFRSGSLTYRSFVAVKKPRV